MLRSTSILALLLAWSPVALAGGGNEFDLSIHGFYVVDFVAYLALMGFLFKKPARQFLEDRHAKAKAEMEEATGIKAEAEERVERYDGADGAAGLFDEEDASAGGGCEGGAGWAAWLDLFFVAPAVQWPPAPLPDQFRAHVDPPDRADALRWEHPLPKFNSPVIKT